MFSWAIIYQDLSSISGWDRDIHGLADGHNPEVDVKLQTC